MYILDILDYHVLKQISGKQTTSSFCLFSIVGYFQRPNCTQYIFRGKKHTQMLRCQRRLSKNSMAILCRMLGWVTLHFQYGFHRFTPVRAILAAYRHIAKEKLFHCQDRCCIFKSDPRSVVRPGEANRPQHNTKLLLSAIIRGKMDEDIHAR